MSYFIAPDTGARYDIFGHGGAAAAAERMGMPFLGEVPLEMAIRETSDAGPAGGRHRSRRPPGRGISGHRTRNPAPRSPQLRRR